MESMGCLCSKRCSEKFELQLLLQNACRCSSYQIKTTTPQFRYFLLWVELLFLINVPTELLLLNATLV